MCIAVGTTVEEVDVCHLRKRVVFTLHHGSNTSNHFNCSELRISSDCLYGATVCSREYAYAPTHWIWVTAYPSVRYELLIVACFLLITAFLGFLHSSGYLETCSLLYPRW
jgi:hypothetical protein